MLAPYRAGQAAWRAMAPGGDPFASESADYTATITATPGVQIVAGGEMKREDNAREDNVWHFELPPAGRLLHRQPALLGNAREHERCDLLALQPLTSTRALRR